MTHLNTDDVLRKCKELRKMKKDVEAIDLLDKAIERDTDARLFYSRGTMLYLMDQPERAIEDLTSAIALDETKPEYYFDRACILSHLLERDEEAIRDFQHVLNLDTDNIEAHRQICLSLLVMGRPNRALVHAMAALKLAPNEGDSHFCLGESYMSLEQFHEAAASFKRAIELDPTQNHYSTALARALENQGAN